MALFSSNNYLISKDADNSLICHIFFANQLSLKLVSTPFRSARQSSVQDMKIQGEHYLLYSLVGGSKGWITMQDRDNEVTRYQLKPES